MVSVRWVSRFFFGLVVFSAVSVGFCEFGVSFLCRAVRVLRVDRRGGDSRLFFVFVFVAEDFEGVARSVGGGVVSGVVGD